MNRDPISRIAQEVLYRQALENHSLTPTQVLESVSADLPSGQLLRAWALLETGLFAEASLLLDKLNGTELHAVEQRSFEQLNQAVGIWHQLSHGVDSDKYGHWLNENNIPGKAFLLPLCRKTLGIPS